MIPDTLIRWNVLGCLGLVFLLAVSPILAQPPTDTSEKVKFDTVDQVTLQGTFYPAKEGRKAPCVLLLHSLRDGGHHLQWDDLAFELQSDGLSVLAFDFRGFGDSRQVGEGFWQVAENRRLIRGFQPLELPETIDAGDFLAAYYPMLVNDIVAAKSFLDRKNDTRECNAAELIVIGAGEGATLGAMWLASECARYQVIGAINPRLDAKSAICDVMGALWLTPASTLGQKPVPMLDWLKTVGREQKVRMAFLYGEDDKAAARWAERCLSAAKPRQETTNLTAARGITEAKANGMDLLKSKYDTSRLILNYIANVRKDRAAAVWEVREFNDQALVWSWPGTSPVLAKMPGEASLRLLPLAPLGFR